MPSYKASDDARRKSVDDILRLATSDKNAGTAVDGVVASDVVGGPTKMQQLELQNRLLQQQVASHCRLTDIKVRKCFANKKALDGRDDAYEVLTTHSASKNMSCG